MIACLTVRHEYKPILSCLFFVACATATIISTSILIQNKMNSKTKELLDKLLVGNRGALARAITLVESQNPHHMKQANLLLERASQHLKSDRAFCVGIAGPPGAGKSSFIETLGLHILQNTPATNKLSVLCIDPSSNLTGGSILGDKTRMTQLSKESRAYVRPSPTRGMLGGVTATTLDAVHICQAAGYESCMIETVGLGQSEIEVAQACDLLLLLLPPAAGDGLQGVKKGIVEVADMIVVNKADGDLLPSARHTASDYRSALCFARSTERHEESVPVMLASALTGDGIAPVWETIVELRDRMDLSGNLSAKRRVQGQYWMWKMMKDVIMAQIQNDAELKTKASELDKLLSEGLITSRGAANQLLDAVSSVWTSTDEKK